MGINLSTRFKQYTNWRMSSIYHGFLIETAHILSVGTVKMYSEDVQ